MKKEDENEKEKSLDKRINNFFTKQQQQSVTDKHATREWKLEFERVQQYQTIQHARPATNFQFTEFDTNKQDFKNFHKYDITKKFS